MVGKDELSPDGRWAIRWRTIKDFNSYFESDSTYWISVVNVASKKEFTSFVRSEFANASGSENSGIKSVRFAPDSSAIIADYEDGRTESIALPARSCCILHLAKAFFRN